MAIRNLLLLTTVAALMSGCQTWKPDRMPPPAALPQVSETGIVEVRYWNNVGGSGVSNLTGLAAYPDNPDVVMELNELSSPRNRADSYGSLVRGFIIPPADGMYRFFVSGDGETQFWLSTDGNPQTAQMIALVPGAADPNDYSRYASQASGTIEMEANNRYYFEIVHKERSGSDHFNVAWEGPGFSRQIVGSNAIASFGQPPQDPDGPVGQEDIESAYTLGYRVGFFDKSQNLSYDPEYPPRDQDQDGLYDNWEVVHGLNPNDSQDASTDRDDDLLNALDEFYLGTDPNDADTDQDALPDGVEFANELDPLNPDDASQDLDGDGFSNLQEYREGSDMADASDMPNVVDSDTARIKGFVGQYFLGTDFEQFVMIREDNDIDFTWGREKPAPEIPSDNFSIRWVGTFDPPHASGSREYLFRTLTDDGMRLYLDGQLIINGWKRQGTTPYETTRTLSAEETINITIEYFEGVSAATARFDIVDIATGEELDLLEVITSPNYENERSLIEGADFDNDGIPDSWELAHGIRPWSADSAEIVNDTSVTNLEAFQSGLSPWTLEPTGTANGETSPPSQGTTNETGEVTLSWTPPSTRVDGTPLRSADIRAYEVAYGQDPEALINSHPVAIGDTSTVIRGLAPGTWYFAVRTIADLPGPLSETIEYTVE